MSAMMRLRLGSALAVGCFTLCLAGCGNEPVAEKKVEPPPEPITGQRALYRMYSVARSTWARDVMVEKMSSLRVNGMTDPAPGKANAWEATFFSPSIGSARPYTYSIVEQLPDLHKDVFAGSPQSSSNPSFLIAAVKTDSDAAYQTALAKAAKDAQRNAGKPILVLLELDRKYPDPTWRIVWGDSISTAGLSVFVDANTGEYLSTMH